jgi:hypothetical protein
LTIGSSAVAEDVWTGRTRSELVTTLGEPTSRKRLPGGGERLVYKLVRFEEGTAPAGMIVITLPGIGLVGRPASEQPVPEEVSVEPTVVDEDGQLVAGGVTTRQTKEITWSSKDGLEEAPEEPEQPATLGKIKVAFVLDPQGTVRDWFALPRQRAR